MRRQLIMTDIHGRENVFDNVYEIENPDDVLLLGDYMDSHGEYPIETKKQIEGLKHLLDVQKHHNRGSFIMLIGNHDFHYIDGSQKYSQFSRYNDRHASPILIDALNSKKLQYVVADVKNKILWAHAGVTNKWMHLNGVKSLSAINDLGVAYFEFTYGEAWSPYGDDPANGPLWVRPMSLLNDMYKDEDGIVWKQVVGHTCNDKPYMFGLDGKQYDDINDSRVKMVLLDTDMHNYIIASYEDDGSLANMELKEC